MRSRWRTSTPTCHPTYSTDVLPRWLHQHWLGLRRALHAALCLPLLWLAAGAWLHTFGPNLLEAVMHSTGRWALYLLLSALLITPARRLAALLCSLLRVGFGKRMTDWNWLVRLRRMLGLWCFTYAALHFGLYFWLDTGLDARALAEDLGEKPYLAVGLVTLLILLALAATSNDAAMRRMGRRWKALHRLSHVAPVLALLHFWMMTKPGYLTPLPMTASTTPNRPARPRRWPCRWPASLIAAEAPSARPPRKCRAWNSRVAAWARSSGSSTASPSRPTSWR